MYCIKKSSLVVFVLFSLFYFILITRFFFSFLANSNQTPPLQINTTMANVLWSIIWLIILIIVGFWIAFFCAGWYVLVYPLTVCIPDVAVRIVENLVGSL